MLKKLVKYSWISVLCLFLWACTSGGNISKVEKSISPSTLYHEEEIDNAMDVVVQHFKSNFKGCTLTELDYDEAFSVAQADEWAKQYSTDQAIVLISSFDVDETGGDGSLNPNQTYDNWQWILTREQDGKWILRTWGY